MKTPPNMQCYPESTPSPISLITCAQWLVTVVIHSVSFFATNLCALIWLGKREGHLMQDRNLEQGGLP